MVTNSQAVSFDTTLTGIGTNTGIMVPAGVLHELAGGRRPAVDVEVNGYCYRSTIGVMAGQSLISVSAAVRKSSGLAAGDPIHVTITINETPRAIEIPADLADALQANPGTEEFFATLSNSLQRYHLDNIAGAKTGETRQRRVDKTVALFLEGKRR
ncbi:YdeI/OmpD-associated family protein [Homoserinimonas sp. OAct 916]|uniref:YdeI/OmpD-associated family protein n=1 Tax=Homoserinimonas sp. OAct 916 TaxID=2211450 RepID=UPI000DBE69D9|nr:YdeI/OmpD-associated family protein [Homoserinimonas sp. OAct 916]